MRVAGHDRFDVPVSERNQGDTQALDQRDHVGDFVAQIEPQIERDLIVARARSMQFAPRLAGDRNQAALDRKMNVFIGDIELETTGLDLLLNLLETANDRAQLAGLQQSDFGEHPRMRDRSVNVVAIEPAIERQRRGEGLDFGQPTARESPANKILAGFAVARFFFHGRRMQSSTRQNRGAHQVAGRK